jgi:hypothetical protein
MSLGNLRKSYCNTCKKTPSWDSRTGFHLLFIVTQKKFDKSEPCMADQHRWKWALESSF